MRNPSPPPLTEEETQSLMADYVGETLFSKKWILSILLKLYKHEKDTIYNMQTTEEMKVLELEDECEKDFCELWDMSSNEDVAQFIFSNNGKNILIEVLHETLSPRMMEIAFGLLGNLACFKVIHEDFSEDKNFRENILKYLTISDAPSLVEMTRLILSCFSQETQLKGWLESIKEMDSLKDLVKIVENSLNGKLIGNALELLDIIFYTDDTLLRPFTTNKFLEAIYESVEPVKKEKIEYIVPIIHILQLMSTENEGVKALSENKETISTVINFILILDSRDISQKNMCYVELISILNVLAISCKEDLFSVLNESEIIFEIILNSMQYLVKEKGSRDIKASTSIYLEFFSNIYNQMSKENNSKYENISSSLSNQNNLVLDIVNQCLSVSNHEHWKEYATDIKNILDGNKL